MKPHDIQSHAQTPAPAPEPITTAAKKKRRTDALVVRMTVSIPLQMSDADSLYKATKAIDGIEAALPEGSKIEFAAKGLGKM